MASITDPSTVSVVNAPESKDETPKYQAVACRKASPDDGPDAVGYASSEDAAKRCKELGYDTSDMEEHEDSYVFHQYAPTECKSADTGVEDIEPGMKGLTCGGQKEATDYTKPPEPEKPGTETAKDTEHTPQGTGEAAMNEAGDGVAPKIPVGAQFVKDYCGMHDAIMGLHAEHEGMLENPPIIERAAEWAEDDATHAQELAGLISLLYPEVEFPDEADVDDAAKRVAKKDMDGGDMTAASDDTGEMEEAIMPTDASYLAKMAGCTKACKDLIDSRMSQQGHPDVVKFCKAEPERLDARYAECKDLMTEHFPDHVAKAFPGEEEPKKEDDKPEEKPEAKADEKPEEKKPEEKAAPTNADMLRGILKSLQDLTAAIAQQKATPAPTTAPETPAAAAAVDSSLADKVAKLQLTVANLVEKEKRFQARLASKMGVNGKRSSCECGTCTTCSRKTAYFADDKTLGVTDESHGGSLVPTDGKDTQSDAYNAGFSAGQSNNAATNPYDAGSAEADDWQRGYDDARAKAKSFRIHATHKGSTIVLTPGLPVPLFATDFHIVDGFGKVHDNRYWNDFESAEQMRAKIV